MDASPMLLLFIFQVNSFREYGSNYEHKHLHKGRPDLQILQARISTKNGKRIASKWYTRGACCNLPALINQMYEVSYTCTFLIEKIFACIYILLNVSKVSHSFCDAEELIKKKLCTNSVPQSTEKCVAPTLEKQTFWLPESSNRIQSVDHIVLLFWAWDACWTWP